MKTFLYIVFFCLLFNCCYFGALNNPHPQTLIIVDIVLLVLFAWLMVSRHKKKNERRQQEQYFQEFMRWQMRSKR